MSLTFLSRPPISILGPFSHSLRNCDFANIVLAQHVYISVESAFLAIWWLFKGLAVREENVMVSRVNLGKTMVS